MDNQANYVPKPHYKMELIMYTHYSLFKSLPTRTRLTH